MKLSKLSWKVTTFGDIAKQIKNIIKPSLYNSEIVIKGEHINKSDFHIRTFDNKSDLGYLGPAFHMGFKKGQILYVSRNPHLVKVGYPKFDGICANTTFILETKDELVFRNDLIPFVMLSDTFIRASISNGRGSVNPYVNWKDLASIEIYIPPKSLQPEISKLLWSANDVLESAKKINNKLEKLIGSIVKDRIKNSKTLRVFTVADLLVDGPRNGFSPTCGPDGFGSKTVSIGAVKNGIFDPVENTKFAEVSDDIIRKFSIQKDDFFVVRGNGNKELCGKAGLALQDYPEYFYPDLLIRLRFDEKVVIPKFAALIWNTNASHQLLLRRAKSTNGIWKINGDDVKRHKLKIPSIKEQIEILSEVEKVNKSLTCNQVNLFNAQKLHDSLINSIF